MSHCAHPQVIFDDFENVHVCEKCGLQIVDYAEGDLHFSPRRQGACNGQAIVMSTTSELHAAAQVEHKQSLILLSLNDIIDRVCGNYNIAACIERATRDLLKTDSFRANQRRYRADDYALAAYALYKSCLSLDAARSMTEIGLMFDIPSSAIRTVEKNFDYSDKKFKPSSQIERVRHDIGLSYKQARLIGNFADNLCDTVACAPSTVLATCLYLFSRAISLLEGKKNRPLDVCARLCLVSPTSVRRLARKIRIDLPETAKLIHQLSRQISAPNNLFSLV